jgi:isoleucyl-tRNA synthetase
LCSVAIKETAPYKKVATVGWTLDEQGRALSKSLGNGVDPVDIADRLGAEVVRLWAASVDFREDVAASENLMQRAAENYRKLRNTFKFLLGNLYGFDPVNAVRDEELLPLDRYMLARTRELAEKVLAWYDQFEFHRVYHAVNEFTIVELSALYLDVLKDRMYTFAPVSVERRSAQTVIWKITETLVRLVAPILTFTADEVWSYLPQSADREPSVHLALFPNLDEIALKNETLLGDWKQLLLIRDKALKALEVERRAAGIGKALEAKALFYYPIASDNLQLLNRFEKRDLEELLNVSQVDIKVVSEPGGFASREALDLAVEDSLEVAVRKANGTKCNRCWRFYSDDSEQRVKTFGPWPNVCGRCANALRQMPEFARWENWKEGEA